MIQHVWVSWWSNTSDFRNDPVDVWSVSCENRMNKTVEEKIEQAASSCLLMHCLQLAFFCPLMLCCLQREQIDCLCCTTPFFSEIVWICDLKMTPTHRLIFSNFIHESWSLLKMLRLYCFGLNISSCPPLIPNGTSSWLNVCSMLFLWGWSVLNCVWISYAENNQISFPFLFCLILFPAVYCTTEASKWI